MRTYLVLVCGLVSLLTVGCMGMKRPAPVIGAVWEVSQVDVPPKKIKTESPYFPGDKRGLVLRGKVVVQIVVTTTGEVGDPLVLSSSNDYFTKPAVKAICSWRYRPAMKDGVAVNCRIKIPMNLSIDGTLK